MRKWFSKARLVLAVLILAGSAMAHDVTFNFTASTTPGVASYNAYRAPVTGTTVGTFTKVGNTLTTGFVDATVQPGLKYAYYFTSVCPIAGCSTGVFGESGPSVQVQAIIPTDTPLPPTGINITNISLLNNNGQTTINAQWQGAPGASTYVLTGRNGMVLARGTMTSASGNFVLSTTAKMQQYVNLHVCDSNGCDDGGVRN